MFFFTSLCPAPRIVPECLINERKKGEKEGETEEGRETGAEEWIGRGRKIKNQFVH